MKDIVLYGSGGLGREVAFMIENINRKNETYRLVGFVVDKAYYHSGMEANGYPVLGDDDWLIKHKDDVVCTCAIGEKPVAREAIQHRLTDAGVRFETLIAENVNVHPTVKIGCGSIICNGVLLSVNTQIGDGVFINGRTMLGHDAVIGDYSCIMGNCSITGNVSMGKRVYMGGAAYIVPHITVGDDAVIAAGSIVFTKVKAGTHVLGNPAKRIEL